MTLRPHVRCTQNTLVTNSLKSDRVPGQMFKNKSVSAFISLLLFIGGFSANVLAGEPVVWDINSRAELLKGEARGVSVTDSGILTLSPALSHLFSTDQAYIWSTAMDAAGNIYLGTGHDGKLFRVSPDGKGSILYKASELDVTALAIGGDGAIFAATSPDGKVYRVTADGKAEVYFDPADKYIWSLAVLGDGSLAVGTGDNGKLYRVRAAGAKPENSLLINTNQTHVMSLVVTKQGDLIAGTDPGGLVLRISPDGKAFALYDAPLREIHALASAPDGSIYALGLSDAASTARSAGAANVTQPSEAAAAAATTTVDEAAAQAAQAAQPARSRNDLSTVRSAVFHILPDGSSDVVWSSASVTGFAVTAARGGVLIGTSDKGRIYSVTDDGRDTLLLQSSEGQISSLIARGADVFAASSNQGKLFRFGESPVNEGSYESPVRDAKLVASWGRIWWRGTGPIELQTRTGNSERPDTTWSEWSTPYTDVKGSQITSPKARFIQWRAVLRGAGGTQAPPRRVYQRGARAVQWQGEDRNNDTLEYSVYYRSLNETNFRLLKEHIRENFYTVDGASLADGRYVFKVIASDILDNPLGYALSGERTSEPVDIDNTPPVVRTLSAPQITADRIRVNFEVEDATGRIKRADVSIDGGPWHEVFPDDGIADSQRERYSLNLAVAGAGEHTISLRAFDNSNNVGNISLTVRR